MSSRPGHVRGFSLIEAAIVLGIVGLVIGGIWAAASTVQKNMRLAALQADIVQSSEKLRRLFKPGDYPSSHGDSYDITSLAITSGVFPAGYRFVSGDNYALSPNNAKLSVYLECYNTGIGSCQRFNFVFYGVGVAPDGMPVSECIQLIRRLAAPMKTGSGLLGVQVDSSGAPIVLDLPIDSAAVNCPANFYTLTFFFRP